ncbi:hypothetical protein ACFL3T_01665 [Patescibacteria group bacterium]
MNPKPLDAVPGIDEEAIEGLIAELRLIPDGDKPTIIGSSEIRTINEMIDHLERRTPAGMELLSLDRSVRERTARAQTEKEQNPGIVARIRGAINRLLP